MKEIILIKYGEIILKGLNRHIFEDRLVNNIIKGFYPKEEGLQKIIFEAMNYSIEAGGKRLRPIFMMEVAKLFNGFNKDIEPFMTALEEVYGIHVTERQEIWSNPDKISTMKYQAMNTNKNKR